MLEKTDGTTKNGQSRDIGNVGHTIYRTNKCWRKPMGQPRMDNQEWTIKRYWQRRAHKIQEVDVNKNYEAIKISDTVTTNKKPGMNPDVREG